MKNPKRNLVARVQIAIAYGTVGRKSDVDNKALLDVLKDAATPDELRSRARDLFVYIADGLKVRVHRRYPLAEAAQAQADLASRHTTGKLLLIP